MDIHHKINYLEIPVSDIAAAKAFYAEVFAWQFEDYGWEYCAFTDGVINGGFFKSSLKVAASTGSVLVVFYSQALEATQEKIQHAGGRIIKPIFAFPGGRRFHFSDSTGNEFAVWSDSLV